LRTDIYEWDSAKGCLIMPGMAVRLTRGGMQLEVVFCFECDILVTYLNGREMGSEDFDRAHRALAAVAKQLFPKRRGNPEAQVSGRCPFTSR